MKCPKCGFDPDENIELQEIMKSHGYDRPFVGVRFGPEREGRLIICRACGGITGREDPDSFLFVEVKDLNQVDLSQKSPEVGRAITPPYLQPGGEPQLCEVCEELIMPSDDQFIEPRDGQTYYLCSDECYEEWHQGYYGG